MQRAPPRPLPAHLGGVVRAACAVGASDACRCPPLARPPAAAAAAARGIASAGAGAAIAASLLLLPLVALLLGLLRGLLHGGPGLREGHARHALHKVLLVVHRKAWGQGGTGGRQLGPA